MSREMKKKTGIGLSAIGLSLAACAGNIEWNTPQYVTGDADVCTNGALLYATCSVGEWDTLSVNGVFFTLSSDKHITAVNTRDNIVFSSFTSWTNNLAAGVVLYSDHNGVKSEFKEVLDLCDEVTFWFWNGKNVGTIELQVGKLRDLVGAEKPVLLGQYMWDFGGCKPMPGADMERQLAATSRLLSQKAIHGVIFHCTPLVDMNLDAVNVSRAWIKANGSRKWGT